MTIPPMGATGFSPQPANSADELLRAALQSKNGIPPELLQMLMGNSTMPGGLPESNPGMMPDVQVPGIEAVRASADAPLSDERDTIQAIDGSEGEQPSLQMDLGMPQGGASPEMRSALTTLYGADFPLLNTNADEHDWVQWATNLWDHLGPGVQRKLHLVQRNRLYRNGVQWISSSGYGPWRPPPRARDEVRVVENCIAPALDLRLQILVEQRPGFRCKPATGDQDDLKRAEAKQVALEYQYDQQSMSEVIREAAYWSGTDGVSFLELFWDPDAGPWHEGYSQGGQQPGQPQMQSGHLGDVKCRVRRIEQVRVSANATSTQKPWLWIVRDIMSKAEATKLYGVDVSNEMEGTDPTENLFNNFPMLRMGYQLPNIDELLVEQDKINRYTIYCEKSFGLPKGLSMVVVGQKIVFQGPLLIGCCPMVRWTDGSTDPSFYNGAVMDMWIDSQQRINTIKSKWIENIRLNSGAKMLAKENSIVPEAYTAANMSIISVKGLGGLNEIVKPLDNFSVGADAKEALALERKQFEDLSGWNDTSRGSFSPDQSGRAILAIREQLERTFAPPVNAAARAMSEWAKITCSWMAWGYDIPRDLGVEGKGRPDLVRALTQDDMDGVTDVWIDPETLMPMPRALRLFLLKDLFQQGLMGAQEYRRRLPFAWTQSIGSPDEDQEARAKRCAESLRNGQWLPVLWQDNESIHQDVLERELILPDDTQPQVRQLAIQRWMQYAQQSMMKMGIMPPGGGGGGGGGKKPGKGSNLSAVEQPFAGTNPGIAASQGGVSDQDRAANQFEAQQKVMDQSH